MRSIHENMCKSNIYYHLLTETKKFSSPRFEAKALPTTQTFVCMIEYDLWVCDDGILI
jgi:hypothetical protein